MSNHDQDTPPSPEMADQEIDASTGVEETADTPENNAPECSGEPETPKEETAPPTPEQELTLWKDRALRSQADLENFRKRMAREAMDIRRHANSALFEELLPILDNFELGLQAARQDEAAASLLMGMEMVQKQLLDFLGNQGVKEIEAVGLPFDPTQHDAVSTMTSDTVPEGEILQLVRRGYSLNDRVLRAPTVVVSKGPDAEEGEDA